ncbi:MAG: hypothetical protein J6V14_06305 [Clostridia bacterium]|nr:hypothetical protein [Clostridia bacterium]
MSSMDDGITNEKTYGIDHFLLRCAALLSLTCYVIAFSGIVTNSVLMYVLGCIGYASLPLFALLSMEAYRHAAKLSTLLIRNIIYAVLCAFPYRYAFYSQRSLADIRSYFSLALTCFLCIGSLMFYDRMKTRFQRVFCIAFLCAASLLIGMEFAPYMPILAFAMFIYLREQEGKDAKAIENGDNERIEAIGRRRYLFSKYTFTKVAFIVVTLSVVIFVVSLFFGRSESYRNSFPDELKRNYCMPGMLLALPFIRFYNGKEGFNNKVIKVFLRLFYILLLISVVLIKLFFLYDYA